MANNKIIYYGETLIDLTADTVTPETLLSGQTAHDKSGEIIEGTCTFDSDTSSATVSVAEMLAGKTAYARGAKLTGTMPNNGKVTGTISSITDSFSIPQGYHDGSGSVKLDVNEANKLLPQNIREGIVLLGVTGTMSGSENEKKQAKTVTPTKTGFTVLADPGFTCLSEVVVNPIPYVLTSNAAGGMTVTIG